MNDFCLNWGFSMRKWVIFTKMRDYQRENKWFLRKWGFFKRKQVIFALNRGFLWKKMRDLGAKWEIFKEKMSDFCLHRVFSKRKCMIWGIKGGFLMRKQVIFVLNGGFSKKQRIIFAKMKDFQRVNEWFSLKWGIFKEKMGDFHENEGFSKRK